MVPPKNFAMRRAALGRPTGHHMPWGRWGRGRGLVPITIMRQDQMAVPGHAAVKSPRYKITSGRGILAL